MFNVAMAKVDYKGSYNYCYCTKSSHFSFVLEEKFATIFSLLERFRIKTNLIHNSAVNLSLCVDNSWHIDEAIEALREAGAEVLGVASIFTYGMQKGLDRLAAAGVVNYSLSNLDVLAEVAAEEGYIRPEDKARLIAFRNNPSDESWINK